MNSIVGYWQNDLNSERYYSFKSDGTFTSNVPNRGQYDSTGTYVLNGDKLSVL